MKKQLFLGLAVFGLAFSFSTVVKAESDVTTAGINSGGSNIQQNMMMRKYKMDPELQAKLKLQSEADVQTALSKALAECAKLSTTELQKACTTKVKMRFDAVRNMMNGTAKDDDVKTVRDGIERGEWGMGMKENMQEMRKKFGERIEGGVKMHIENNFIRFEAVYNRFVKIADRIDSRIAKLKTNGTDVSTAVKFMSAARTDLSNAKTAIAELKANWNTVLNTETDTTVDNSAFEKCKAANGGVILKTFPAKCEFEGQTYVDLSVSVSVSATSDTKPTVDGTNSGKFEKLRSLAKTAREALMSAQKNMKEAVKSLPKIEVKTENEVETSN